jgi:phage baseplate assembly protein W
MDELNNLLTDFNEVILPDKTWNIDFNRGVTTSYISGIESVKQAAILILSTERFEFDIYSHEYGVELNALIGDTQNYVMSEVKRRVIEALTQDDRITSVDNFEYKRDGRKLEVKFTVNTSVGDFDGGTEVAL